MRVICGARQKYAQNVDICEKHVRTNKLINIYAQVLNLREICEKIYKSLRDDSFLNKRLRSTY